MAQEPFEPIMLDLTDTQDYVVLIAALEDYADRRHGDAEDEDERIRYEKLPASDSDADRIRAQEARARALTESIDRQIAANAAARPAAS